ncbi:MAG: SGNH/GDSL hydrolase family protein [Bacteroidota bacterium]
MQPLLRTPLTPRPYIGQLATRCRIPTSLFDFGSSVTFTSRTYHFARDTITALQVALPNWYVNRTIFPKLEAASGNSLTLAASIEYPVGVFTQLKFGGAATIAAASGTTTWTDLARVYIPRGAKFYVRIAYTGRFIPMCIAADNVSSGAVTSTYLNEAQGDAIQAGSDLTMSGTLTNTEADWCGPLAIVGPTRRPSFALIGPSLVHGVDDTATGDDSGDMGEMARSVGPTHAYINFGVSGLAAVEYTLAAYPRSFELHRYCSHVMSLIGATDIVDNDTTAADALALERAVWDHLAPRPIHVCTLNFCDVGAGPEAQRIAYNASVRSRPLPTAGYFEIADAVETARDSGVWISGYTTDGVHPDVDGHLAIKNFGGINLRRIGAHVYHMR